MRQLIPSKGWCVVRRDPPPEKTDAGIVLPPSVRERFTGMSPSEDSTVTVVALHPDCALRVAVGDRVVAQARADGMVAYMDEENPGDMVTLGGQRGLIARLYVLKEDCIVAVVGQKEGKTNG